MASIDKALEQEILEASDAYWQVQLAHDVEGLRRVADPLCPFVHMGVTMDREGEAEAFEKGLILTQKVDTLHLDVRVIDKDIAIVLRQVELTALVAGHEAINPFMATETYHRQPDGVWKLVSFIYTHINPEGYVYRFLSE